MIADDLRIRLIDALVKVPLVDTYAGRTSLLSGIPSVAYLTRNPDNLAGDITLMVLQFEENFSQHGKWRLLQFVDNVANTVQGTELGKHLQALANELRNTARSKLISLAEMAQVHLFDLRQPVLMCVGQLPSTCGMTGFVIPGATSLLLRHFCDSLKHRGAELKAWAREHVAATGSPLVIGQLHTSVTRAAGNAGKFEQLLKAKHVIWPAYVRDAPDAEALWQAIQAIFPQPPAHHLVVVFGTPDTGPCPNGMFKLPPPTFTSQDVSNWMDDAASTRACRAVLVKRATALIVRGCNPAGPLPVDVVYERLDRYHRLINEHRDDDNALLQALQELELMGV